MRYADYPRQTVEDIARLRRRLDAGNLPPRRTDHNLLIGTWNIQQFGRVHRAWEENPGSPKRNLRAMAIIAEIVRRFDVVAIQEVKRDTSGIRMLVEGFLGPNWSVILSDVSAGEKGNHERLAYVYDTRRVTPSGLAGEIVLSPVDGIAVEQFDRTPYIVGFRSATDRFALLTAHIRYGDHPQARIPELHSLARFTAEEIRDRSRFAGAEETNLIVLGDFNINRRSGDPLFDAFVSTGLFVPEPIREVKTTYGAEAKHYDQIAWFMGDLDLLSEGRAGVVDFTGAVYQVLTLRQMSYRVSDHFPLWVEFIIDRSTEAMARTLGVNPAMPDPLGTVPD
ncbi:MAG TPA: endonuclease/exonuclease/phosphatase family protein [Longimicrobiaceae bacterium]|nr:endonuclease/exonuclease/phosphatase family protein [Longimicrobiaceae bacterium]